MGALATASAFAALLAACTVGPDYVAPETAAPASWQTPLGEGLSAQASDAASRARWWAQFGDTTLAELIEQALAANTDVRQARARLREARALRAQAAADWYPSVNAAASHSRSRGSGAYGSSRASSFYQAGFDAMWEADLFGGVRRANEAAQADMGRILGERDG